VWEELREAPIAPHPRQGWFLFPVLTVAILVHVKRHLAGVIFILFSEMGSHCIAQAGLKFAILLPQPPEGWDQACAPHPALTGVFL
jgi:hypothetical protein